MGLITKSLKLGIPFGFLYYTKQLDLWDVSVGSNEAENRLSNQKNILDSYCKLLRTNFENNVMKIPENTLNIKQYWNCSVYITFNTLANLNSTKIINKGLDTFNDLYKKLEQPKDEK